jgi:hypothetical protein
MAKPNNRSKLVHEHEIHGHSPNHRSGFRSLEYQTWVGMIARCTNEKHGSYSRYGGRGIIVCDRWMNSFVSFLEDMGSRPTSDHTIDRVDRNGNYEPDNCRWATRKEQMRNMANNVLVTANGKTATVVEWAEELGVSANALYLRLKNGWDHHRVINEPVGRKPSKYTEKWGAYKARYKRLREQGLCTVCGKPAEGRSRCSSCAKRRSKC